jgi:hypothetical protein
MVCFLNHKILLLWEEARLNVVTEKVVKAGHKIHVSQDISPQPVMNSANINTHIQSKAKSIITSNRQSVHQLNGTNDPEFNIVILSCFWLV